MKRKFIIILLIFIFFISYEYLIFPGNDRSPIEIIRSANKMIRELYSLKKSDEIEIENKIGKIIEGITDFSVISHRVTGQFCSKLTKKECAEFYSVFRDFIKASVLKRMGRIKKTKVTYIEEDIQGNRATIKTLIYRKEKTVYTNYQMEIMEGKWKIVNYIVDDIDSVTNYREQFEKLFKKRSFREIILRLKKKIDRYKK